MRYKFLFSIFVFFFISVFIALGSWQIVRLNWKLELINQIETSLKDNPVNLASSIKKNYLRIKTNGSIDFDKQIYLYNLNEKGKPGFEVVNPLKIGNENYLLNRILVFEDKLIVGYIDKIKFITSCLVCFDNDLMKRTAGNPVMESLMGKQRSLNIQKDKELKESVFNKFYKLCENEGLRDMTGDMSSDLYDVTISGANNNYKISRSIKVKLDEKFYDFTLSKIVLLEEDSYTVGAYDLKDVSTYDLAKMIDVFLVDCKLNGIKLQNNVIDVKFESLDDNTIGLSYAMNNDTLIKIRIDPQAWSESSTPKKWYLLYHELGHDVLNLEHGNGGKMMFNFADRGYSWSEFWEDKNYMINNYSK